MAETVQQFLSRIGRKGGKVTSPRKIKALKKNAAKARKAKLAKHK